MLELPKRMDRKILNAALLSGAMLIRDDARSRAPVLRIPDPRRRAGTLRRMIRAARIRPREHSASVIVGVRKPTRAAVARYKRTKGASAANNPDDAFYWFFQEFGTSKMSARPFLRPAFEGKKFAAADLIKKTLHARVLAEATKLARTFLR